jgi:hypothetical protein
MGLQIAQALPVRVKCPRCGAVFMVGGPAPVPAAAPAAQAVTRPSRPAGGAVVAPVGIQSAPAPQPAVVPPGEVLIRRPPRRRQKSPLPWILGGAGLLAALAILLIILFTRGKSDATDETAGPPSKQQQIDRAIARGVKYLREQIEQGSKDYYFNDAGAGSQVGVVALAGLTLLECGESPNSSAVRKARETVELAAAQEPKLKFTYSIAVAILFLDRWLEGKPAAEGQQQRELLRHFATQLIASQQDNGGWTYYCNPLTEQQHGKLLADLNAARPVATAGEGRDDNSINQFCTLALWAARKHGVKTDASLKMIEERYRRNQNDNGSWGYRERDNGLLKDATTCAGLIGLAVGQGLEAEKAQAKDKGKAVRRDVTRDDLAIKKGLEYITRSDKGKGGLAPQAIGRSPKSVSEAERANRHKHTEDMMKLYRKWQEAGPDERPAIQAQIKSLDDARLMKGTYIGADAWGDLYFLWSVERAAVIFGLRTINGKDWYEWGADVLLKNQKEDGSWRDRFPGICDTCFALLFLKRANVAKDLTDKLRGAQVQASIQADPNRPRPDPAWPGRRSRSA